MDLHSFDHNLHDVDVNAGQDLHSDLNSPLQDLHDPNSALDNHNMGLQHDSLNHSELEFLDTYDLHNPIDNQHLTSYQPDYINSFSEPQHFDLSQSSQIHDAFDNQHFDAHNFHQSNNLLEHHNLADSHLQAHDLHQNQLMSEPHSWDHHDLQRSGTSRSELLEKAKYYDGIAHDYENQYKTHSEYADDFRSQHNWDEASSQDRDARTASKHYDEYTQKAQEARDKAKEM